jgi:hypothetical protein
MNKKADLAAELLKDQHREFSEEGEEKLFRELNLIV